MYQVQRISLTDVEDWLYFHIITKYEDMITFQIIKRMPLNKFRQSPQELFKSQ